MVKRTNQVARQARQRAFVASAFSRLADGTPLSGADLFGDEWRDGGSWTRRLVKRLLDDGVLVEHQSQGRWRLYAVAPGVNLHDYLDDPARLVALIWPSQAQPAISPSPAPIPAAPDPSTWEDAHEIIAHAVNALDARLDALGVLSDNTRHDVLEAVAETIAVAVRATADAERAAASRTPAGDLDTDEVLSALLRLAGATAENMIYIRERVDALVKAWE